MPENPPAAASRLPRLPAQVVDARGPEVREAASEFCRFLFTPAAQHEFARLGFRVNPRTCKEVAAQQTGLPPANLWQVGRGLMGSLDRAWCARGAGWSSWIVCNEPPRVLALSSPAHPASTHLTHDQPRLARSRLRVQVDKELGGWAAAQKKFFDAGAILDDIQSAVGKLRVEQRKAAQAAARR